MKSRDLLITCSLLLCPFLAHPQCGRSDFARIQFDYFPGHRVPDRRSAVLLQALLGSHPHIVVEIAERPHEPFYSIPTQFKTEDSGNSWLPIYSAQPKELPAVPYGYFRSLSDPKIAYRLVPELGLYVRSENGGQTWSLPEYIVEGKTRDQFAAQVAGRDGFRLDFSIVAVHPTQPHTVYAGIRAVPWFDSDLDLKSHKLVGIYRSTDAGDHWEKFTPEIIPFNLSWAGVSALGISPLNPNVMIGAGRHGIEKTQDGGKTWTPVGQVDLLETRPIYREEQKSHRQMLGAPVVQDLYEFVFDPGSADTLYMLTNRGIYKTVDSEKSWRLLNLGFDEIDAINSLALNPRNSEQLIVGSRYGIFISDDGGCHFHQIPGPGGADLKKGDSLN